MSVTSLRNFQPRFFKFRSIMFEMGVIYSLIVAVTLLLFSAVVYYIISDTLYLELDNEVRFKAEEISSNIRAYMVVKGKEPGALSYALEQTIASDHKPAQRWWANSFDRNWIKKVGEQDLSESYINLSSLDGISIVHSPDLSEELLKDFKSKVLLPDEKGNFFNTTHLGRSLRVFNYPVEFDEGKKYILQVGLSVKPVLLLLRSWMNRVFMSIPIIAILTSFMGCLLAARILRPVDKISAMANIISYEDLSKRVDTKSSYEEMENLTDAFNQMIDRLEKSFTHIQSFSSAIAHELKTPLTIMRGEAELALMSKRTPEEYEQALTVVLSEIKGMLKIISDLLFLTKVEYQSGIFDFVEINFAEYFQEVFNQSKMLAANKNIELHLDVATKNRIMIKADPLHLKRLFFNLLDNAIKFSTAGKHIDIRITYKDKEVVTTIKDYGTGIKPDDLDKIFTLFYSADKHTSGSGLGLTTAQSIAKGHGGKIEVTSQLGVGSAFMVTLPTV